MNSTQIVVVGSINADLSTRVVRHPRPGETLPGSGGRFSPGGKGANQAAAAALLGADVALVGAVGSDPPAEAALRVLRRAGVDLAAVAVTEESTGLAVITVSEDGENTIVVVPGANATVGAAYVERHVDLIAGAEVLLMQGEIPAEGFQRAAELATGRVVVNLAPVVPVDRAALLRADPLLANEHEAGLVLAQLGAAAPGREPRELATALLEQGFASVVLTLGAAGALVAVPGHLTEIPTPQVKAVDTTGCGDGFAGALVGRLAEGEDLVSAAHYAARVGAFAATRPGAQDSYPGVGDRLPEV